MPVLNYPGPYEIRLYYVVGGITHSARYNVNLQDIPDPGDAFTTMNLVERGGGITPANTAVDAWVVLLKPLFHTGVTFTHAEMWKYEAESYNADFISAYNVNVAGTSASVPVNAAQVVMTFRTVEGGVLKVNLMELSQSEGLPQTYTAMNATYKAIADFVVSVDNWLLGRDTSYPFAFMRMFPGTNEALARRRYRPA